MTNKSDAYRTRGIALTLALRNYLNGIASRSVLTDALRAFETVIPDYHPEPFVDHDYPDSCNPVLGQDPELAEAAQELDIAVREARAHQAPPARDLQSPKRASPARDPDGGNP